MAFLGFALLFLFGLFLVIIGLALFYGSTQIGDRSAPLVLLLSVAGAAIIYFACHHAPFVITVAGGAQ